MCNIVRVVCAATGKVVEVRGSRCYQREESVIPFQISESIKTPDWDRTQGLLQ